MSTAGCSDCSQEEHDAIKARVDYFMLETVCQRVWLAEHLLVGECRLCLGTLALQLCAICREACPLPDALPWGPPDDGRAAHFECAARTLVKGRRGRFVILAGRTVAKEFDTVALAAQKGGGS